MGADLKPEIAFAEYAVSVAQRDLRQAQDRLIACQEKLERLKLSANESSAPTDTRTLLNG